MRQNNFWWQFRYLVSVSIFFALFFVLLCSTKFCLADSAKDSLTPSGADRLTDIDNPRLKPIDLNVSVSGRSYPFGVMPSAQVGYGQLLWGPGPLIASDGSRRWQYGYARTNVQLQTVGVTNRAFFEAEVYPISIFGISAGTGMSHRHLKQDAAFDCVTVLCGGVLWRDYVQTQLVAGAGTFFLMGWGRYERFRPDNETQVFREEGSAILGHRGGDELRTLTGLVGFTINRNWNAGVLLSSQYFVHTGSQNQTFLVLLNHIKGPWRLSVGAGEFRSTFHEPGFTASLSVIRILRPSLALIE